MEWWVIAAYLMLAVMNIGLAMVHFEHHSTTIGVMYCIVGACWAFLTGYTLYQERKRRRR